MDPYQNTNQAPPPPPPPNYHMPPPPPPQMHQVNSSIYQIPTMGNYVVVQLLAMIPIVGFILMIIWAVGGNDTPIWKSNYARAFFVMMAISVGISILFTILFFGVIAAALSSIPYYY